MVGSPHCTGSGSHPQMLFSLKKMQGFTYSIVYCTNALLVIDELIRNWQTIGKSRTIFSLPKIGWFNLVSNISIGELSTLPKDILLKFLMKKFSL